MAVVMIMVFFFFKFCEDIHDFGHLYYKCLILIQIFAMPIIYENVCVRFIWSLAT